MHRRLSLEVHGLGVTAANAERSQQLAPSQMQLIGRGVVRRVSFERALEDDTFARWFRAPNSRAAAVIASACVPSP
jgi:hypothetical protein